MKVAIIGGGPGGLYFAILLKRQAPASTLTVYERDAADETFGWGIALSDETLSFLRESDERTHQALAHHTVSWDQLDFSLEGQRLRVKGTPTVGIGRRLLLDALRARAAELGVEVRLARPVHDLRSLPDADLIVGADGANSLVRRTFEAVLRPSLRTGRNVYVWLAVRLQLEAFTLAIRSTPAGVFAVHAYPYEPGHSSVIVECAEETWTRAKLDRLSDLEACSYLADAFAGEFGGHLFLTNDRMRWKHFMLVDNERWSHERVALVGDALHTVHFSTGSGTRVALEDAIALAGALVRHRSVDAALETYERERRPAAAAAQAQALASLEWFERLDRVARLPLPRLAWEAITQTRRVDPARLAVLDPELARRAGAPPA